MTPEEHDHVQQLEALVKRYRRRIVELKEEIEAANDTARSWERRYRTLARRHRDFLIDARF